MPSCSWGCFYHSTCLNPAYSLRRQLLISFGVTGILTTSLVVGLACLCAISAGNLVQDEARNFMRQEVIYSISNSSQHAAETFSQELDHLRGSVSLIVEIVRDRIAGYPRPGWEDDMFVPFPTYPDANSGEAQKQQQYPLNSPLLPRDWNVPLNVNISNYEEHLQELVQLLHKQHTQSEDDQGRFVIPYHALPRLSTASAVYAFQGNCDPSARETDTTYYPNCTQANNDGSLGGVVRPTSTNAGLEQKAADIGVLLKPIWESRPDLLQASVHFVNEGAGSMVHFPSFVHQNDDKAYKSIGCDWLHENINPNTGRPFLSKSQTARCKPEGSWVPRREFNPMEQDWCRDQALYPNATRFYGPMVDSFFTPGVFNLKEGSNNELYFWVVRVGRAIFDRYTGEFVGCVALGVLTNRWTELITDSLAVQNHSAAVVVRADDGVVVAGGDWNLYNSRTTVHVTDTNVVSSPDQYIELMEELERIVKEDEELQKSNDPKEGEFSFPTAIIACSSGRVLSASVLPGSDLIYIQAVGEERFDVIDQIKRCIDKDVIYLTLLALIIGGVGMVILMIIVYTVSMVLTRPLSWMQQVAWSIVNHNVAVSERQSLRVDDKSVQGQFEASRYMPLKWTPKTEITELVEEFKQMIRGFSGAGRASAVAKSTVHEIRNTLAWQSQFQQLYKKAKAAEATDGDPEGPLGQQLDLESKCGSSTTSTTGEDDDHSGEGAKPGHSGSDAVPCANGDVESNLKAHEPSVSDCRFRSANTGQPGSDDVITAMVQPGTEPEAKAPPLSSTTTTTTTTALHSSLFGSDHEWKNVGRNLNPPFVQTAKHQHESSACIPIKSSLFRWILVLIVIPMIVTNVVIVKTVSTTILSVLPQWLESVEGASFDVQVDDLSVASKFEAIYAEALLATPVRDLFVVTRVAEWLFTDAIDRQTNAFVEMNSGAEDCKGHSGDSIQECPWYDPILNNDPCDCSWEDPQPRSCSVWGEKTDTRRMQKLFYAGQSNDADPVTGRRVNSSYPEVDNTPGNTSWWKNLSIVPGAFKGNQASGYETTYDRVRVVSALSAMIFPLYNYRPSLVDPVDHKFLAVSFGFESDGMLAGWAGCVHPSPGYPHFQSSEGNHAGSIRPELCPYGSYGYDARCRDWYAAGRRAAREATNGTSVHVTPPYQFPGTDIVGSSVTQAIIDPRTGAYIGQTLVDFLQFEMKDFGLDRMEESFHFVITPSADSGGTDTVVGPDPKEDALSASNAIGDRVLPYDGANSTNRQAFDSIVRAMKEGHARLQNFTRTTREAGEDGLTVEKEETIWLAYDPIHIRALDSVQSDDYTRGLSVSKSLVYSLGVARTAASLEKPFKEFEKDAGQRLEKNVTIYMAMILLISVLATAITCRISVIVTRPMITLLHVVQNINDGKIDDDIPPLLGGSREVNQVYTSFAKLYKIVRVSNSAFFSRNLNWACHFVRDALKLFTKIDDKKAIAIASANLGSTLLAINCGRPKQSRRICLENDGICCVREAFLHFETAVQSGTEDFEEALLMSRKVEFAEQLSDRLFNRGLFFLLCKDDPCADEKFEEFGLQDLMKAQALDHDGQEYLINNGLLMQKSSVLFDRLLRRLNGLCVLLENDIEQNIWDVKSLAHDCHRLLSAVWEDPSAPMFEEHTQIGRLQQLEGVLVQLQLQRNQEAEAARIAIRMLVEDEYVNEGAFQYAAAAVLQYMTKEESLESLPPSSWSTLTKASAQSDIQQMLKACKQGASQHSRKCMFLCLELCDDAHIMNANLQRQLLALYDSHCGADDFFGLVACNAMSNTRMQLDMECKRQKQGEQTRAIESAIDALGFSPTASAASIDFLMNRAGKSSNRTCKALSTALDKVMESEPSSVYDTYLLYVTDGPKQNWDWKVMHSLKCRIEEMNAKRRGDIHLIMIDLEVTNMTGREEEHADGYVAACANLCGVSQGSAYIKASLDSLEEDFKGIKASLSVANNATTPCSNALLSGITMEKF